MAASTCTGWSAGRKGTLAVIGEVTLRLVRRPKVKALVQLHFATLDDAAQAAAAVFLMQPAACELMDATAGGHRAQGLPAFCQGPAAAGRGGQPDRRIRRGHAGGG